MPKRGKECRKRSKECRDLREGKLACISRIINLRDKFDEISRFQFDASFRKGRDRERDLNLNMACLPGDFQVLRQSQVLTFSGCLTPAASHIS